MKRRKTMILVVLLTTLLQGASAYGAASEIEEQQFGYFVDAQLTDQFLVLESESITGWVQEIGRRVAAVSGRPQLHYTFRVLVDPVVNAFSGPGGYIYITTGFLLDHIKSDDELAAVLAHEVAHVSERHQVEAVRDAQIAKGVAITLQILAAAGGAALAGLATEGMTAGPFYSQSQAALAQLQADLVSRAISQVVAQAGGTAGNMLVLAVYKGFGRREEQTADELAVHYLDQAGFNMDGFVSVLDTLNTLAKAEKTQVMIPHFLASHPDLQQRITSVRGLIADVRKRKRNG